jgi:chaperonin GroES
VSIRSNNRKELDTRGARSIMTLGGGDQLARGAVKAQFTTPNVTDERWKEMFGGDSGFEERMRKKALAEGLTEEQYEAAKQEAVRQAEEMEQETKREREALQATFKIRAIQDRIIVRRVEAENKLGKLYLADETVEKPYEGIAIAVGPGRYIGTEFVKPTVAVGERVVFGKFSGAEVKLGLETLLVLREEDIFLVKENGENPNE